MVAGRPPFARPTTADTVAALLTAEPPDLSSAEPPVPPALEQAVHRALEKDPQARFQSAQDLALRLRLLSPAVGALAVLRCANESGDAELEYLGDGIADSLIHDLSQLPGLRVMARSTVFRYRGPDVEPRRVGRELKVDAVLTGRVVRRAGDE